MVTPAPRGLISYQLNSTVARRALSAFVVLFVGGNLQIIADRPDILPFVDNSVVGRYRFATTPFVGDSTRSAGNSILRDPLTAVFGVSLDFFTSNAFIDIWVTDALGVPVNLVNNQGFTFSLLIRDS